MEKMSDRELQMLRDLQAKQKRVQRAEEEFFREVDSRREELLNRWNIQDRLSVAAERIGTDSDTLYEWIVSEPQITYFHRTHASDDKDL